MYNTDFSVSPCSASLFRDLFIVYINCIFIINLLSYAQNPSIIQNHGKKVKSKIPLYEDD